MKASAIVCSWRRGRRLTGRQVDERAWLVGLQSSVRFPNGPFLSGSRFFPDILAGVVTVTARGPLRPPAEPGRGVLQRRRVAPGGLQPLILPAAVLDLGVHDLLPPLDRRRGKK
jgi:hypothetical protein